MPTVIATRWVSSDDLDRALQVQPPGTRVGVNRSYDMFEHEGIPVEWECDFDHRPTGDEQSVVVMAVTNGLRAAGIEILQSMNGLTL